MKFADALSTIVTSVFSVLQRANRLMNRLLNMPKSTARLSRGRNLLFSFIPSRSSTFTGDCPVNVFATLNDHGQRRYFEIAESAAAAGHVSTPSIAIVSLARLSDRSQLVIAVSPFASRVESVRSRVRSCCSRRVSRNRLPIGTRLRTRAYLRACVRRSKVHQRDRQSYHDTCAIRARARRSARRSVVARAVQVEMLKKC